MQDFEVDDIIIPSAQLSNVQVYLFNNAYINITTEGTLSLVSDTFIQARTSVAPAVYNHGTVALLGRTAANFTLGARLGLSILSEIASLGSLTSILAVHGGFVQSATGSTTVYLNHTTQPLPVLYLVNSRNYTGSMNIDFYTNVDNAVYPDILLYDTDTVSQWTIVAFSERYSEDSYFSFTTLNIKAQSPGLSFSQSKSIITASSSGSISTISDTTITVITVVDDDVDGSQQEASSMVTTTNTDNDDKTATNFMRGAYNRDHSSIVANTDINPLTTTSSSTTSNSSSTTTPTSSSTTYTFNNTHYYVWGVEIVGIGCDEVNDYYYGVPQQNLIQSVSPDLYTCYACLKNSSCNLCNSGQCALAGACGSSGK